MQPHQSQRNAPLARSHLLRGEHCAARVVDVQEALQVVKLVGRTGFLHVAERQLVLKAIALRDFQHQLRLERACAITHEAGGQMNRDRMYLCDHAVRSRTELKTRWIVEWLHAAARLANGIIYRAQARCWWVRAPSMCRMQFSLGQLTQQRFTERRHLDADS